MPLIDARPDAVDHLIRPGVTYTLTLPWPTGELAGRTFTSTLDGEALDVTIVGDTMTIEATDTVTGALEVGVPVQWLLLEDIDGTDEPILVGTWTPSNSPRAVNSSTVQVSVDGATIQVTVNSSQASIVALDARLDTAEADIDAIQALDVTQDGRLTALETSDTVLFARVGETVTWFDADAWDRFDEVPVSSPGDSTPVLTVDSGFGVATGGLPSAGGDDRRIYYLADDIADAEVRLDFEIAAGNSQCGIALRGDAAEAVVVWSNIVFGVNSTLLQGVWEFDGDTLAQINQDADSIAGFAGAVASASGDGTTVTVLTALPHHLEPGDLVGLTGVGSFDNVTVVATPTSTAFTFTNSTSGTWAGGTWTPLFTPGRRKVAVRLIGDQVTFKQWLPWEDEPAWDDADRAETNTIPATLDGGGPAPATGRVGLIVAHLGDDGQVVVNDLQVTNLDPLGGIPPSPVADDAQALDALGAQVARIDSLDPFRRGQWTPADAGVLAWAYDPGLGGAQAVLTDGTIFLIGVLLRDQVTVSNVVWGVTSAATGPAETGQNQVALYNAAGTRLGAAVVVDSAISSTGVKTTAITPVAAGPGLVWAAFLFNVTSGNPPQFQRMGGSNSALMSLGRTAATARWATAGTGQTALPASIVPGSNTLIGNSFWAAVS